ncbi:hypothetical protein [Marinomonas sp. 2405UD68-3]|uniref:DUF7482 domain-containing protein n=1 Tax=Marinomonas sp. 2405UD68-3 TaxID=3391835 RepID=UPI0039C8EA82
MSYKYLLSIMFAVLLSACGSHAVNDRHSLHDEPPLKQGYISLPVFEAWYEDDVVFYVTTDVSNRKMARDMKANYAPRLRDAIPKYPKPPGVKTALERVYGVANGPQQRKIFPSVPWPIGPESRDKQYSPLWLMYNVVWVDPSKAYILKSEGAIFDAEEKGLVTIERTNIVVNCPVVYPSA